MARYTHCLWLLLLAVIGGCQSPMYDVVLSNLQEQRQELAVHNEVDRSANMASGGRKSPDVSLNQGANAPTSPALPRAGLGDPVTLTNYQEDAGPAQPEPKPSLTIPPGLPGAQFGPIHLPKEPDQLKEYLTKLYPPLPPLEAQPMLAPGPEGRPLSLPDLQRLALLYSPAIKAAEANVVAAQGAMRQSLAYPNPIFSFENDTPQTGQAGYEGFGIDQLIKTGNKLELAGAAAAMDLRNAQMALRRARFDVAYQVRVNYFGVLAALEGVKISRAFAEFTDQIYATQIKLLLGKQVAAYEPMQLRPIALQARFNLIQATNQYQASWRQLAANLGLKDMPPSELVGSVDMPVPVFEYDLAKARVLSWHTDVLTAKNNIHKSEYNLKLAKIQPVPDVDLHVLVQKDYTGPPNHTGASVTAGIALPIWDLNKGAILQAQGNLTQALHQLSATENTLLATLADAFNRYRTNKAQVDIAVQQVTDQVRVYQALYSRYRGGDKTIGFNDLVTAQQALSGYVTIYIGALSLQWTAVADVANLMQTDDLFKGTEGIDNADVPHLEQLQQMLRFVPMTTDQGAGLAPTPGEVLVGRGA